MRVIVAAAITAALCPRLAAAGQNQPVPAFTVLATGGTPVRSDALTAAPRWLLVYVGRETVSGDRLLRAMDAWGIDPSRAVVIVAGDAPSIDGRIRPLLPSIGASMSIYADVDGSAARALGLRSAPALLGIVDGTIDWSLQGVLNDPAMVEPVVRSWLVHQ